ncbi:GNAT family N-acetyltransferase [Salinibacterium sp. M195]|uniref:GNAT family N-acetyltransferase n=1 Tax=Salinibacterium sp. M195 TaxID=2583374 RepID=UPI001C6303D1|nr:GNAT family N-acetyltransferase [Salinibacterium sp. M195]QYH35757.1 GNAT family N-acetyltransferase [Salinibacterium sp. M195]
MTSDSEHRVWLERWQFDDLPVLERSNTPEMTAFLGGPESDKQIVTRHAKFLHLWETDEARMFRIRSAAADDPVGSVGFWKKSWRNKDVYETGWSVHTAHQGLGIAGRALSECIQYAADNGDRDQVFAFPRTDNAASNALCRRAGFTLAGEADFEYPQGHPIHVNEWMFDLSALR